MTHNPESIGFSSSPPAGWEALCAEKQDLFNTPQWHAVLSQGLKTETLYGYAADSSFCFSISVFRAGPFRIGYFGFPVGGTLGGGAIPETVMAELKRGRFPVPVHSIKIPVSAFSETPALGLASEKACETAILNLGEWNPRKIERIKYVLSKARTTPVLIDDSSGSAEAEEVYAFYRNTVTRHRGSLRYTSEYFKALLLLSNGSGILKTFLARLDGKIIGFVTCACHGDTAYYLHGGMNPEYKNHIPSDLLLMRAIQWAKARGMRRFNLMGSPKSQFSLLRYKEKWGGVTREESIYELPVRRLPALAFKVASTLYRLIPRIIPWKR